MPREDTQFKPGISGNPGGAPAGKRISTWMAEIGEMLILPLPETLPINGRIALARIVAAMGPNGARDTEIILDRTENKQVQTFVFSSSQRVSAIDSKLDAIEATSGRSANA